MTTDNSCESCQAVMINGVYCLETGCPDAWKNTSVSCQDCSEDFYPKWRGQNLCDHCEADQRHHEESHRDLYYDRPCGDVDYDHSDRVAYQSELIERGRGG